MVRVGRFCIDRWEASLVDLKTRRALSPYYPPSPVLLERIAQVWEVERQVLGDTVARELPLPDLPRWQRHERFEPAAVSRPGVVPAGYLSQPLARRACENAGKRLCTEEEWLTACRGRRGSKFPYGPAYVAGRCNVFRPLHPAAVLHGHASIGHTDPRLNLVRDERGEPLLHLTGDRAGCASEWEEGALFDMVGNLDEWVAEERGVFVGGFYARSTSAGCDARIASHAPAYYDYSTGTRCCADAR